MRVSKRWLGICGVVAVVAPRLVLSLHRKVTLRGFTRSEGDEPSSWLVRGTRCVGLAALLFVLFGSEPRKDTDGEDSTDGQIDFV